MKLKICLTGITLFLVFASQVNAATLNYLDLPSAIQTEIFRQEMSTNYFIGADWLDPYNHGTFASFLDTPNFSVFDFKTASKAPDQSFTNPPAVPPGPDSFLIRYNLDPSSHVTSTSQQSNTASSLLAGSAWLLVGQNLNAGLTLYRDKVQLLGPDSNNIYYDDRAFSVYFTNTAAAIDGFGHSSGPNDQEEDAGLTQTMHVSSSSFLYGTSYDITLNFIGLSYDTNGQVSINPFDSRVSLFSFNQHGVEFYNSNETKMETLNVAPVPLPSGMVMFASAMLLLLFRVNRLKYKKINFLISHS